MALFKINYIPKLFILLITLFLIYLIKFFNTTKLIYLINIISRDWILNSIKT